MKYLLMFCAFTVLFSCTEEEVKEKKVTPKETVLTEVKNGVFHQYYPGTKKIKFQGPQDEAGKRHGIWYFFAEDGKQLSMTEYKHGLKNGVSMHRYSNGGIHYTGEYENDVQVGIWKTYEPNGKLKDSINYTDLNKKLKN